MNNGAVFASSVFALGRNMMRRSEELQAYGLIGLPLFAAVMQRHLAGLHALRREELEAP